MAALGDASMTPAKRALDLFFAALLICLLWPLIIGIAIAAWLSQGRPILYVSERMKTESEAFHMWKFRTMRIAEDDSGVSGGDKDKRITKFGAFLRATRLDELPQLWNIIRGDLSFVGPRPPLRQYVDRFPELYARVLRSRPGVTGLASLRLHRFEEKVLSGCNSPEETDAVYTRRCIPRKAKLDLLYQRNHTLCFDFLLAFETIGTLFRRAKRRQ